eukprot:4659231-Karenia_brevis.AAC.1
MSIIRWRMWINTPTLLDKVIKDDPSTFLRGKDFGPLQYRAQNGDKCSASELGLGFPSPTLCKKPSQFKKS